MLRTGLIAALLIASVPAFGLNQWPRECRRDITKVCRELVKEADQAILGCLQGNEKKLTNPAASCCKATATSPNNVLAPSTSVRSGGAMAGPLACG